MTVLKWVLELVAPGNKLGESHQGPVEPECSIAVGLKPEQVGEGLKSSFCCRQRGQVTASLLLSPVSQGQLASLTLPRKGRGAGTAIPGHSPALGEQGLKGEKVFEQDPAQLYCLKPYLFSSMPSNVSVTCAPRAKLPFTASAAKKADKPEHLHLQSPLLHKRQGQTENMCFIFENLSDLY